MSTIPNGHDRGRRRLEDRRREAIEYLNSPCDRFAHQREQAINRRAARHVSFLESKVPRAPRRDCSAMAHRIVDEDLTRREAVAILLERWAGGGA